MKKLQAIFCTPDGRSCTLTFVLICCLFGLSGAFSGMIDVLNKHFQASLKISHAESALVQAAWYGSYFMLAMPAGWLAAKRGYRTGIVAGLLLAAIGCLIFLPAVGLRASYAVVFAGFLLALFIVGSGMTFLATISNPYTTVLGSPEAAVFRINLAQTCDAIGWMIGPIVMGSYVMSKTGAANTSNSRIYLPYLVLAGIVAVLMLVFMLAPVPDIQAPDEHENQRDSAVQPLFKERHFICAVGAQVLYVAAQTGIFSFFINDVKDPGSSPAIPMWALHWVPMDMRYTQGHGWFITEYGASMMLSAAFGLFTFGRLCGSVVLKFLAAHRVLGAYAVINIGLMALVMLKLGWLSVIALMLSFFFMSIMYPTIFALGIRGLGARAKFASSFIVMAIVGGAVMPLVMGWVADETSMRIGFVVPLICFVFIAGYAVLWRRLVMADVAPVEALT